MMTYTLLPSPLGELLAVASSRGLAGLYLPGDRHGPGTPDVDWRRDDSAFLSLHSQLGAYFDGQPVSFDVPLDLVGTPFRKRVWEALRAIPYGMTTSYADIARRIGAPSAARAVGMANGRNPVAIIVPCHRVIGSNGAMTGYASGIANKCYLLELESKPVYKIARSA